MFQRLAVYADTVWFESSQGYGLFSASLAAEAPVLRRFGLPKYWTFMNLAYSPVNGAVACPGATNRSLELISGLHGLAPVRVAANPLPEPNMEFRSVAFFDLGFWLATQSGREGMAETPGSLLRFDPATRTFDRVDPPVSAGAEFRFELFKGARLIATPDGIAILSLGNKLFAMLRDGKLEVRETASLGKYDVSGHCVGSQPVLLGPSEAGTSLKRINSANDVVTIRTWDRVPWQRRPSSVVVTENKTVVVMDIGAEIFYCRDGSEEWRSLSVPDWLSERFGRLRLPNGDWV